MLRALASCWSKENFEVKIEESEKANYQPSQSSICTAQVGLKCLSRTPGSHSCISYYMAASAI